MSGAIRAGTVITTNEDLARLHPAVVRPGRCLAQIEIGRLTRTESLAWLDDADGADGGDDADARAETEAAALVGRDGATLAELVALRKGERAPSADQDAPAPTTGFYL
jgi:hypothetical protein